MTPGNPNIKEIFSRDDYALRDGIYIFPGAEKHKDYWMAHSVGTRKESFNKFLGGRWYKLALEVGAGDGRCTASFARISDQIVALEPSHKALMHLRAKRDIPNVTCVESYGVDLPFNDNTFDLLASITVIEHIPPRDHIRALKEWFRVLKPGGEMVAQNDTLIYHFTEFLRGIAVPGSHINMITARRFGADLESVGFKIIAGYYFPFHRFTRRNLPLFDLLATKGLFVCRKPRV